MQHLSITATADNQNALFDELLPMIAKLDCNIEETRMLTLGERFGALLLVGGNWNNIAKLEDSLSSLDQPNIQVNVLRTKLQTTQDPLLPYLVQIVALDAPGLLQGITRFFTGLNIIINDLQVNRFAAIQTSTNMANILISISIPKQVNLADLRERFLFMCDELNIDGIIEPEKR